MSITRNARVANNPLKRLRWRLAAIVLVVALPTLFMARCFGQFPVIRAVYKAHDSIQVGSPTATKVVKSGLLWLVIISVPVYAFSAVLDFFVFNVIEFWTGRPVFSAHELPDGGKIVMKSEGSVLRIDVHKKEGTRTFYALRDRPNTLFILKDGKFVEVEASSMELGDLTAASVKADGEVIQAKMLLTRDVREIGSENAQWNQRMMMQEFQEQSL
ncbi:MAG: DUF3332 family protein [Leptospiraceae bacterium]|nr:DUF3332 family protein [Leptospiraceae bacterium]MCB1304332.1 DUF3332 family protein [Leptospiraceae bacterium]